MSIMITEQDFYRPAGLSSLLAAATPVSAGQVSSIRGLGLEVAGLRPPVGWRGEDELRLSSGAQIPVGAVVEVGACRVPAEVVSSSTESLYCMPLAPLNSVAVGDEVHLVNKPASVPAGPGLIGRVLDGLGRPIDIGGKLGSAPLGEHEMVPLEANSPNPMSRSRITEQLQLGVRALDTMTAVGRGQRMGLFAGSGVGKSSLLSMIARGTAAEVNVIVLIGERGREVREFLEDDLGPEGLARSIVVVATADEPAQMRLRAASTGTRIAEYFRSGGADVLLMMDSLTRVAMAQREIGLSAGEPPATRGYPPSTFSMLARLLERAGTDDVGSITGIYTVLVDGDDHNEPIADAARSILDGHVTLDRHLATGGHYPPIDVLGSISRVASRVTTAEQRKIAETLRKAMAAKRSAQDLLDVGAYAPGSNPVVDVAVAHQDSIDAFLRQGIEDSTSTAQSWKQLDSLVKGWGI